MFRLKRAGLLAVWFAAAATGSILAGVKSQSWLILAATGVVGVVIQARNWSGLFDWVLLSGVEPAR